MPRPSVTVLLLLLTLLGNLYADRLTGTVNEVQDGDTLSVDAGAGGVRVIRLHGIDCPEGGQAYTEEARDVVATRCLGQAVEVQVRSVDRAGRSVASVILPDGSDLALALVEGGYAWCYPAHGPVPEAFRAAEVIARHERLGLWQDLQPVEPWKWKPNATAPAAVPPTTLPGEITQVADGDSLTLKTADGKEHALRLYGVDAPEGGRPFSEAASAFVATATLGSTVTAQELGPPDSHGRKVARVICSDGQDLGLALVTAGLAWWQPQQAPDDALLRDAEQEARQARRGLWQDDNPKPPWMK
jgi:endonuclease YncB( thermonuclease family)